MHFLIVKMSAFGDIVHTYPIVHFLKECYPDCRIDWVVEKRMAELVRDHPLIDNTIVIDRKNLKELFATVWALRKTRYDALFDVQGNCKSALVSFFAKAKEKVGFGFKTCSEWLNPFVMTKRFNPPKGLNVRLENLYIVEQFIGRKAEPVFNVALTLKNALENYPDNAWLICPGSNWPNKKLTMNTLIAFLQLIEERYHPPFVFLCGNAEEKKEADLLAAQFKNSIILEKPKLSILQNAMQRSKVVISMDSLPLHLASTTSAATFSIFGPSSEQKYAPIGANHKSVQGSCPYGKTFERRCAILRSCPTGACMHNLDPHALFEELNNFLRISRTIQPELSSL